MPGAPESSLPFLDALKPRKSKPVNGKPQTTATIPATTECHFAKPNTKSTTAQIEKKARGVGRFISPALCSSSLSDSESKTATEDECNRDLSPTTSRERTAASSLKYFSGGLDCVYRVRPPCVKGQMRDHLDHFIFGYAILACPLKVSPELFRSI